MLNREDSVSSRCQPLTAAPDPESRVRKRACHSRSVSSIAASLGAQPLESMTSLGELVMWAVMDADAMPVCVAALSAGCSGKAVKVI